MNLSYRDGRNAIGARCRACRSPRRRTRAIRQDPRVASVVYAGTTEGLWKTDNAGNSWTLQTPPGLIVNDVAVDPADSSHLLLATDRAGILESRDGAHTFFDANSGFSHRQVWRVLAGASGMIATVRHDKEYGGVFLSSDGLTWRGISASGLAGNDVLRVARLSTGYLLAGASGGGLYLYRASKDAWGDDRKNLASRKTLRLRTHRHGGIAARRGSRRPRGNRRRTLCRDARRRAALE